MVLRVSEDVLARAEALARSGDPHGAWKVLSEAGDKYAANAAEITVSNTSPTLSQFLVIHTWSSSVGYEMYREKFSAVAKSHLTNYLSYIRANDYVLPKTIHIERSYVDALNVNGVSSLAAIDIAINNLSMSGIGLTWPNLLDAFDLKLSNDFDIEDERRSTERLTTEQRWYEAAWQITKVGLGATTSYETSFLAGHVSEVVFSLSWVVDGTQQQIERITSGQLFSRPALPESISVVTAPSDLSPYSNTALPHATPTLATSLSPQTISPSVNSVASIIPTTPTTSIFSGPLRDGTPGWIAYGSALGPGGVGSGGGGNGNNNGYHDDGWVSFHVGPVSLSDDDVRGSNSGINNKPILLDLSGDGLRVDELSESTQYIDLDGDGFLNRTAWASNGTGVLVLDADGDGKITRSSEFVFTDWDPSASGDLQAVKNVFDTNRNGKLDDGDERWGEFKVSINGQLKSLAELGIASIDLTPSGSGQAFSDGSTIVGTTVFTRTDGSTGAVGDAVLVSDQESYKIERSVNTASDGSSVELIVGKAQDGQTKFRTLVDTNSDGTNVNIKFDDDGDGVYDRSQTKSKYLTEDGSLVEIVTDFNADNSIASTIKTETLQDKSQVTILLDRYGTGLVDQYQVLEKFADGSSRTTVQDLGRDGSILKSVVTTSSSDGFSKSTSTDVSGDGIAELVSTENITVIDEYTRSKISKELAGNGSVLRSTAVTATRMPDRTVTTTAIDSDGDGSTDRRIEETTTQGSGSVSSEKLSYSADGTVLGKTTSYTSQTAQTVQQSTDIDGDGTFDTKISDVTTVGINGIKTRTETVESGNGNILSKRTVTTSADGHRVNETFDKNGDNVVDATVSSSVQTDGTTTITEATFGKDGSLSSKTTTHTSADGATIESSTDIDGDGAIDSRVSTIKTVSSDGSVSLSTITTGGNGNLIKHTTSTTSLDATNTSTMVDLNGDGLFDRQTSEVLTFNDDASRRKIYTVYSNDGTLIGKTISDVSSDRLATGISTDANGDGVVDQTHRETISPDGKRVIEEKFFTRSGALYNSLVKTISANGLKTTTSLDVDGNGTTDFSTISETVINDDGSRKDTIANKSANGKLFSSSSILTSGNGLAITRERDLNGDGKADVRTVETTTYNADGSVKASQSSYQGNKLISKTENVTSGNGLSTTVSQDIDGDGDIDRVLRTTRVINANGSTSEEVVNKAGSGSLLSRAVTSISADQDTRQVDLDANGDGVLDSRVTLARLANGVTQSTTERLTSGGQVTSHHITETSANGLSSSWRTDLDGDGTADLRGSDNTILFADGSKTRTISQIRVGEGAAFKQSTHASADGLTTTVTWYDGESVVRSESQTKVLNSDGTVTQTLTVSKADGSTLSREVSTETAHGIVSTLSRDLDGNGIVDQEVARTIKSDGNIELKNSDFNLAGNLIGRKTITTRLNGARETVDYDFNGDGVIDRKYDYSTSIESTGKKIVWLSEYGLGQNGLILKNKQATYETADGLSLQKNYDLGGDGSTDFSFTESTNLSGNGNKVRTVKVYNAGALGSQIVTTTSANGLSVTSQWDQTGSGVFTQSSTDVISHTASGAVVREIVATKSDGTLLSALSTTTSADGLSSVATEHRAGLVDRTINVNKTIRADGSTVEETSRFGIAGELLDKVRTETSADQLSQSVLIDANGDGTIDQKTETALSWWGERTLTTTNFSQDGSILQSTKSTTATDGLLTVTQWDLDGDGIFDQKRVETRMLNADGSLTVIQTDTDLATGSIKFGFTDKASADGRVRTISKDLNGDGVTDQIETIETSITGQTRSTVSNNAVARETKYLPSGSVVWKSAVAYSTESEVSLDGSITTVRYDYDGDGTFETTMKSQRQIDGSVISEFLQLDANGSAIATGQSTTSADGKTVVLAKDVDNDGDVDERHTSFVREDGSITLKKETLAQDGAVSETVVDTVNSLGALIVRQTRDALGRKTQEIELRTNGSSKTTVFDGGSGSILSVAEATSAGLLSFSTLYDPLNNNTWTRVEQSYDPEGRKISEKQFLDDGTSVTISFVAQSGAQVKSDYFNAAGTKTGTLEFDVNNVQIWSRLFKSFNQTGETLTQIEYRDDNSRIEYTYDVPNAQVWSRYTNYFDSAGGLYYAHQLNDNGTVNASTLDPSNIHTWARVDQAFDSSGRLTSQVEYMDNGYRSEYTYDASNAQPWQRYTNLFDNAGRHYYAQQLNDDGSMYSVDFDVHNSQPWSRHEQGFDTAGRRTSLSLVQDNGNRNTTIYDAAGNQNWDRIEQSFDSAGRILTQIQFFDDGKRWDTTFDAYNQQNWYSTTNYNRLSGDTQRIDYDDGTFRVYFRYTPRHYGWNHYDPSGRLIDQWRYEHQSNDPVVIDLNNDGHIDLRPMDVSANSGQGVPVFDWDGDGLGDQTGWVGPQDGLLAIDLAADGSTGSDGVIDQAKELAFTLWPTEDQDATNSDLEALRLVFDTNHDGRLSAEDARWSEFRVWQDINQNGVSDVGELSTLDQLGIKYINLIPTPDGAQNFADGSAITGTSFLEKVDGQTRLVGDVRLAFQSSPAVA